MKKIIFGIVIGIALGSGIVYATVTYKASDISYEPSDTSWEVDNVNDALNSLYDKQKNNTKKALVFTSSPVDMKQYTDRWAELTTADFKVGCTGAKGVGLIRWDDASVGETHTETAKPSMSYDATTGALTFKNNSSQGHTYSTQVTTSTTGVFVVWLGTIGGN